MRDTSNSACHDSRHQVVRVVSIVFFGTRSFSVFSRSDQVCSTSSASGRHRAGCAFCGRCSSAFSMVFEESSRFWYYR